MVGSSIRFSCPVETRCTTAPLVVEIRRRPEAISDMLRSRDAAATYEFGLGHRQIEGGEPGA
jgi:hypothetical protein